MTQTNEASAVRRTYDPEVGKELERLAAYSIAFELIRDGVAPENLLAVRAILVDLDKASDGLIDLLGEQVLDALRRLQAALGDPEFRQVYGLA